MGTRWEPDTCKCVLEYDEVGENGVPIWTATQLCEKHTTPEEALAENQAANRIKPVDG